MGQDAHMFDDMTPREMYKMLKDAKADIMLSGRRSQFVALKATMPWLDINQERHHAYIGYEGMVELVEEIDKALYNPVWEQVRRPAPWEDPRELAENGDGADGSRGRDACRRSDSRRGSAAGQAHLPVQIGGPGHAGRCDPRPRVDIDRRREGGHQCLRKLRRLFDPHRGNPRVRGSGAISASGGGVGSMAMVTISKKACAVNPLKMSQPIGGALAFMGLRGAMPLLHGSQGCTSFGLVLFVRHFKEAIPLQTTAMSEVATVLGGFENVEQAVLNIYNRDQAGNHRHLLYRSDGDKRRRR